MSQLTYQPDQNKPTSPATPSLWKSIILVIILVSLAVSLFGAIIFLFISGAQRLGWSSSTHIIIVIVISGIFAWLVKRMTDIVAGMGARWFSEESEQNN